MVHLVMNDCQDLIWPHYGKCTVLVIVLTVYILVIHIFDAFPLVSIVQLHANWMSVSKACIYSQAIQLVIVSLCNKLLVLDDTQLRQRNGSTIHSWPTSLTSTNMFFHFVHACKTI